jgi:hypothetical protein
MGKPGALSTAPSLFRRQSNEVKAGVFEQQLLAMNTGLSATLNKLPC